MFALCQSFSGLNSVLPESWLTANVHHGNNFDHFSAGFTSFHRKEEIRDWYDGWNDVAVRYAGVANESIYARGTRP